MPRFNDYGFPAYISVAERLRQAREEMEILRKNGVDVQPVEIEGRAIAKTFWGEAWCQHLESFSDYENRLTRGRTYVRNGSVCHLGISRGKIEARVAGHEVYLVEVKIEELAEKKWQSVLRRCTGKIGSLLELLQGKLSSEVMAVVTARDDGLFPLPNEIGFDCDCPDGARMCKHIAAVLYGVGARLDHSPELLFTLRGVNHDELISVDTDAAISTATRAGRAKTLAADNLGDIFGIDLAAPIPKKRKKK